MYFFILGEDPAIFAPSAVPTNFPMILMTTKKMIIIKTMGGSLKSRCIPLKTKNKRKISSSEYLSSIWKIFSGLALKLATTMPITIIESISSAWTRVASPQHSVRKLSISTKKTPSLSLAIRVVMKLKIKPMAHPRMTDPAMIRHGTRKAALVLNVSWDMMPRARTTATLKFIMPSTSSKAATLSMVEVTSPRDLYSWLIASATEGSVGHPRQPSKRANGIKAANHVACGKFVTRGSSTRNPAVITRKVIWASSIVI